MAFEIFVARRYLRAKRKHRFDLRGDGDLGGRRRHRRDGADRCHGHQQRRPAGDAQQLLGATSHVYLLEKERGYRDRELAVLHRALPQNRTRQGHGAGALCPGDDLGRDQRQGRHPERDPARGGIEGFRTSCAISKKARSRASSGPKGCRASLSATAGAGDRRAPEFRRQSDQPARRDDAARPGHRRETFPGNRDLPLRLIRLRRWLGLRRSQGCAAGALARRRHQPHRIPPGRPEPGPDDGGETARRWPAPS